MEKLGKAALCLIVFGFVFFSVILKIFLSFRVGFFEAAVLLASLVPLAGFYVYLRSYRVNRGGWEYEKQVAKLLSSPLNDEYYLINGVHFRGGGDIDHIVLGPNGVFAVETKNWRGKISCNGDLWQRRGRRIVGSQSEQAKKNAAKIRHELEGSGKISFSVWVDAVVIFTKSHTDLQTHNSTVPILRLHQLPKYITTHKNHNHAYTDHELESIGNEIRNL